MICDNCENIYLEQAIKQWLRQRTGNLRTCPTCREVWTNFDIYINQSNVNIADIYLVSLPELD